MLGLGLARQHFGFNGLGQHRPNPLGESVGGGKEGRREEVDQKPSQPTLEPWARDLLVDQGATHVKQMSILHATRASALATATSQAPVQVFLGAARGLLALENLANQVDAPTRAIELVSQELIGRASRRAKTTMHALAQKVLPKFGRQGVFIVGGEGGLHKRAMDASTGQGLGESVRHLKTGSHC